MGQLLAMSLATTQSQTCEYCHSSFEHGYTEDYCSEECALSQKGKKALRNIKEDHRFCGTCYKPIKVVYRPEDDVTPELRKKALLIRDSFIGFQDITEFGQTGNFGIECDCGNVDHYQDNPELRDNQPYEWFLYLAFSKFEEEGQIHTDFSIQTFADVYWQTNELDLAVGKALYDS